MRKKLLKEKKIEKKKEEIILDGAYRVEKVEKTMIKRN